MVSERDERERQKTCEERKSHKDDEKDRDIPSDRQGRDWNVPSDTRRT